ncbi:MAG: hypothetical protein V7647_1305 [Acidobacteriota bacterium]|jgi:hypothetical protein
MDRTSQTQMEAWLRAASDDADRRGLPQLKPLLETLARATSALREADRAARDDHAGSASAGPATFGSSGGRTETTE